MHKQDYIDNDGKSLSACFKNIKCALNIWNVKININFYINMQKSSCNTFPSCAFVLLMIIKLVCSCILLIYQISLEGIIGWNDILNLHKIGVEL